MYFFDVSISSCMSVFLSLDNYTDDESAQPDAPDAGGTGESNNFNCKYH